MLLLQGIISIRLIFRLGIAYAGTRREEVLELLLPIVSDTTVTMELSSLAALSLGLVFVGTCNGDVASTILQTLMERDESSLKDTYSRLMGTGLALLFIGTLVFLLMIRPTRGCRCDSRNFKGN